MEHCIPLLCQLLRPNYDPLLQLDSTDPQLIKSTLLCVSSLGDFLAWAAVASPSADNVVVVVLSLLLCLSTVN